MSVESDINSFRHEDLHLDVIRHEFDDGETHYVKQVYYHGTDELTDVRERIDEKEYREKLETVKESDEWVER